MDIRILLFISILTNQYTFVCNKRKFCYWKINLKKTNLKYFHVFFRFSFPLIYQIIIISLLKDGITFLETPIHTQLSEHLESNNLLNDLPIRL